MSGDCSNLRTMSYSVSYNFVVSDTSLGVPAVVPPTDPTTVRSVQNNYSPLCSIPQNRLFSPKFVIIRQVRSQSGEFFDGQVA